MTEQSQDVFVVPYNRDKGQRAAGLGATLSVVSAVLATVVGAVIVAAMWWVASDDSATPLTWITALVVTAVMGLAVWMSWRPVRAMIRNRRNVAAVTDALHISASGLGFPDTERGGWIEIPWAAVEAAQVVNWRTIKILHFAVAPDLRPDQPGVSGLSDRGALKSLTRKTMGMVGPRFGVSMLQRPLGDIDAALRHYSRGQIGLS